VLESDGDATVTQKVIAPYLAEDEQIEDLPLSSVIITPKNYNFHFMGEATIANTLAAVFRIVPKKRRSGLIRGELWIDPATGVAVLEVGYFVKTSSADIRRIDIVRDTKVQGGSPWSRITHLAVQTRRAGRGYLTITEFLPAGTTAIFEPAFPSRCDWKSNSNCGQNWNWTGSARQHTMTRQTSLVQDSLMQRKVLLTILGSIWLLPVVGAAYQILGSRMDAHRSPEPGHLVDIAGYRLKINYAGSGSPTVVLESGLGDLLPEWRPVQLRISSFTRVCSYDRAGYGESDADHSHEQVCRLLAKCTRFCKMLENIRRIFWSVTRSPERIKKTSTPTKPPRNPGVATWKAPINRTATPRNPSISERNMSFGFTLSARSFGDLGGVEMTKSGPSH
jgi:hypothetical protein